jgi:hypothetical protein
MKTSELTGAELDWAVAKCEGTISGAESLVRTDWLVPYSTDWTQGGPIIEREGVSMRFCEKDARGAWYAVLGKNRFLSPDFEGSGPTPLIAVMRCYVASKLGDTVEIPQELIK